MLFPLSYTYVFVPDLNYCVEIFTSLPESAQAFFNAAWDVFSTYLKNSVLVISGGVRPTQHPVIAETCCCLGPFDTCFFLC